MLSPIADVVTPGEVVVEFVKALSGLYPQRSCVWISAIQFGLSGLTAGISVSVPTPELLICLKLSAANACAKSLVGINVP